MRFDKKQRGQPFGGHPRRHWLLQALLVGLNHLLDHLAADGAGFPGSQVAVVAFLQVHANLL